MTDTPDPPDAAPDAASEAGTGQAVALAALRRILKPAIRLALAEGVSHASLQELVKAVLVEVASDAHPDLLPHRKVSRISTTTGLNRREVTRLVQAGLVTRAPRPAAAEQVFSVWRTEPALRCADGSLRVLPRLGPFPSFESLARRVTLDVHPTSILGELQRLELARVEVAADGTEQVVLLREAFVPQGDRPRMLELLAANVGDHFSAAVDNVLVSDWRHFDQAVFASGLSEADLAEFRGMVSAQWRALTADVVPALRARLQPRPDEAPAEVAARQTAPRTPRHRVRLGMYAFTEVLPPAD